MLRCRSCGFQATTQEEESKIEYHHIIPECIGGTDLDGRIALCRKCHHKTNTKRKYWEEYLNDCS